MYRSMTRSTLRRYHKFYILKMLFNYLFEYDVVLYSLFAGTAGFMTYKFITLINPTQANKVCKLMYDKTTLRELVKERLKVLLFQL